MQLVWSSFKTNCTLNHARRSDNTQDHHLSNIHPNV